MPLLGGSGERLAEEPTRVGFLRLEASDLPMIHRWPHIPHVARWWYEDTGPYEKVARHYSAYIEGEEPFEPYLILHEGRPVGYIQSGTGSPRTKNTGSSWASKTPRG